MVLLGRFTLAEALEQVQCLEQIPLYDALFKATSPAITQKGERYLRESSQDHDRLMIRLGVSARKHAGIWESISLALENAFLRGNKADSKLEVVVRVYEGLAGKVVQIIDSGDGFDYHDVVRRVYAEEDYAQGRGKGLRTISWSPVIAGYEGKGNVLNMAIMQKNLE